MNVRTFQRDHGPFDQPGSTPVAVVTVITAKLPAGSYVLLAKALIGSVAPALSTCQLTLQVEAAAETVLDDTTFNFINTATHQLQRAVTLASPGVVRLKAGSTSQWNSGFASIIAVQADSLVGVNATG
jgi:hypothetical protein